MQIQYVPGDQHRNFDSYLTELSFFGILLDWSTELIGSNFKLFSATQSSSTGVRGQVAYQVNFNMHPLLAVES